MNKLLLSLLLLLPLGATASTLNIVTTCNPPGGPSIVTNTGCSSIVSAPNHGASASASVAMTTASNPAAYSNLSIQQTVFANGLVAGAATWVPASASSQVNYASTLLTAGPPRAGYIQLAVSGSYLFSPGNVGGGGIITGPQALNGFSLNVACLSANTCPNPPYIAQNTFAFELGTAFPLNYAALLFANSANDADGPSGTTLNLTYQVRFFESDGITPVAVSEVPEPAVFSLLSLSFCIVLIAKRRQ